jgi:predicted phosphodiesterase
MKIALCSDLHLEFGDIYLPNKENADVLILSGDIMIAQDLHDHPEPDIPHTPEILKILGSRQLKAQLYRDFLKRCSSEFPHVIYLAGNHEFYNGKWPMGVQYLRDECSKFKNIHYLEMDSVEIDEVTFVGGTLWTDMNRDDPLTLHAIKDLMNDFQIIQNSDKGFRALSPADVAERHRHTVQYIKNVIAEKHDKKFVVVGHHAPSKLSTHPWYANDQLMNGAYSSDLSEFIMDHPQIKLWTHGHTHHNFDYMIGDTRIVCNPRGYAKYEIRSENFEIKYLEI